MKMENITDVYDLPRIESEEIEKRSCSDIPVERLGGLVETLRKGDVVLFTLGKYQFAVMEPCSWANDTLEKVLGYSLLLFGRVAGYEDIHVNCHEVCSSTDSLRIALDLVDQWEILLWPELDDKQAVKSEEGE
jgi:hypothetical protein